MKARQLLFWTALFCATLAMADPIHPTEPKKPAPMPKVPPGAEVITLGAGCFWCTEAVYQQIPGVLSVTSGYMGGSVKNPTYDQVCTGRTGHAEVAQIVYDPKVTSLDKILATFWHIHDPTSLNRQGADVGTQYRSVIFYESDKQKAEAEASLQQAQKMFDKPIVTEIQPLRHFYKAEDYHQEYFKNHPNAPYCMFVIRPKLDKLHLK